MARGSRGRFRASRRADMYSASEYPGANCRAEAVIDSAPAVSPEASREAAGARNASAWAREAAAASGDAPARAQAAPPNVSRNSEANIEKARPFIAPRSRANLLAAFR